MVSVVPLLLRAGVESCSCSGGIYTSSIDLRAGGVVRTESKHRFELGVTLPPPLQWESRAPGARPGESSRTGGHRPSAVRGEHLMEIPIAVPRTPR